MKRIRSQRDGFRRCGRAWTRKGVEVEESAFTPEQWETLKADPMLLVEEVEEELRMEGTDPESLTVANLTEALIASKVEIPKGAKKADLVALYRQVQEG